MRDLVLRLHVAGEHEHVIAAIEAALIHGQAQPWMYEVLALSMEIAGRPKEDVERVLLSGVDFTGADYENILFSAAYLTRFGRPEPALHLYRQASRLEPTRPEPYVFGLKLARRLNDWEAVGWAAAGILTYAWTHNYQQLHREAENAVADAEQFLKQAGKPDEAAVLSERMQQARQRDLILKLTWSGPGDLDLIVEEPLGTICSFEMPQSPGGGVLVHDGYGPDQKNCYEEYVCALGSPGHYRVRVRHVWGEIVGKRAKLTITRYQNTPRESVRTFVVQLDQEDQVVRVSLEHGRRTELTPVAERNREARHQPRRRRTILQMVGELDSGSRRAARNFGMSQRNRNQAGSAGGLTIANSVGYQPVITVLSEGMSMGAMAVISGDRRYVRISTVPTLSAITDVFTFSFLNAGGGNAGGGGTGN